MSADSTLEGAVLLGRADGDEPYRVSVLGGFPPGEVGDCTHPLPVHRVTMRSASVALLVGG